MGITVPLREQVLPGQLGAFTEALRWALARPPAALESSVPGLFAVGDVRHRSVKRVASAVGDGAVVVAQVHEHLDRESGAAAR